MVELVVEQRGEQFCVISEDGKNLGCYDTQAEADERLGEVMGYKGDAADVEPESELAQPRAFAIDLGQSMINRPGTKRAWLDLTREGDFAGYPTTDGRGIQITRRTLEQLLASVKRAEQPIPVDGGGISAPHELVRDSGAPAAGWLLDATIVVDKRGRGHLWGWVELQPEVAQAIEAGALLYGSVAYDEGGVDHVTGSKVGATLHSYALTNKPFVPGLNPHKLDRELPGRYRIAASVDAVSLMRAELPEDRMMSNESKSTAVDQLAAQLAEAQARIVQLTTQVAGYEAEAEERKTAELELQIAQEVQAICDDHGIRLSDDARKPLIVMAAAQGVDAVRTTIAAVNQPPVGVVMSDKAAPLTFASKDDAIKQLSAEIGKTKPNLNEYEVLRLTLRELSKTHPELV